MKDPLARKAKFTCGDWRVRKIFEWLKRKPNPELTNITSKLDQLNQSVTSNAMTQTAALTQLNEKADKTLQSISTIGEQVTVSSQAMPQEMRRVILEALQVWIKLEETRKELQSAIHQIPDASGKTPGNVSGISPESGRVRPDTRSQPEELKGLRIELERLTLRQRQLISILMERGWLTYEEIAEHLRISVSRARNYVSEIIGRGFPVSKVDSIEGKKIGIATTIQDFILEDKHPDTSGRTSGTDD
jgi:DNA-directed RNA polymerase specialized sigma24 family protein